MDDILKLYYNFILCVIYKGQFPQTHNLPEKQTIVSGDFFIFASWGND